MEKSTEILRTQYCIECHERMLRAKAILSRYGDEFPDSMGYDMLHQEFDSLVGAARAVNLKPVYDFNRAMASLTRYLRNNLPISATETESQLLRRAIALLMECHGKREGCVLDDTARIEIITNEAVRLLEQSR
jgi:hypothetical protein